MKDKVFIFSQEEFVVLAAASGIREMYGFAFDGPMEEPKTVLAMQKLTEKGILTAIGEKFEVREDVSSMFSQIKNEKTIIDVHKRSGHKCIVYIGEYGVRVSFSKNREGMLEMQQLPISEIWAALTEEGWIPER